VTVAVIIVNWNGGSFLSQCLEALDRQRRRPDHIIVVDNASTDDSLERARRRLTGVELIRLTENVGFAKANNIGATAAHPFDALALLNPDARADAGWLEALLLAAERDPATAAFASQMRLAESPDQLDGAGDSYHVSGRAWRNGHRIPSRDWPAEDCEVFAPCAAAALYRRDAFEDVGGFDEQFFCYFEDVDLGFRLRLQGHRCVYVHSAIVEHASSGISGYRSDFSVYHGERNAVWTFVKDMPGPLLWWYLPQHIALNLAALVYYPWRGQGGVAFKAKFDALRGLGNVLRRRAQVQRTRRADVHALRRAMTGGLMTPYITRYTASLGKSYTRGEKAG
jgi:GT2 family glycosyltransferase